MDLNDILDLIKYGENETVEFKEKVSRTIHQEISAMANSKGGIILFGINDSGKIIGCDLKSVKEKVSSQIQSIIPPPDIEFHQFKFEKKSLVALSVKKGEGLSSIGGVVYIRIGTSIRPLSIQEILILSSELGTYEWDGIPLLPDNVADKDYIEKFFNVIKETRGNDIASSDIQRYLRSRGAMKDGKLTNAGVLFFTDSTAHIPQSAVRVVFMNVGKPTGEMIFEGPVWRMIDDAYDALIREIGKEEVVVGTKRKKVYHFPPRIIREALINAVAHRNYSVRADIRINVDSDSLTIRNPGGLLPGVDLEDPEHVPRNPSLCNLLYDMGYIERYGKGIILMREEASKLDFLELDYRITMNRFEIVLKIDRGAYLDDIDREILANMTSLRNSRELSEFAGLSVPATVTRLKKLEGMGLVKKTGRGPSTRYSRE